MSCSVRRSRQDALAYGSRAVVQSVVGRLEVGTGEGGGGRGRWGGAGGGWWAGVVGRPTSSKQTAYCMEGVP